jgi:hypothetical protein
MNFNETYYLDYLIKNFKNWAMQYDNKSKEDEFETLYYFTYQSIKESGVSAMTKIDYFNKLKDIKNLVY